MDKSNSVDEVKYVAVKRHLVAAAGSESVVLHEMTGVYFGLNSSARRIWEMMQEPVTLAQLVAEITREFDVSPEVAREDAQSVLSAMVTEGLAAVAD